MLARLSITLMLCAFLLGMAAAVQGSDLSGEQYLKLRKSLGAITPSISTVEHDPSNYIGKVIEVKGCVNGIVKSSDSTSFILNCNSKSITLNASNNPANCIQNGNSIRVLARVGPRSIVSLSDLREMGAAFDYEVTKTEKALAEKSKPTQSAKAYKPAARPSMQVAQTFQMTRQARAMNLSSRAMQVYSPYRNSIARFNPRLTSKQLDEITCSILACSESYGVDPRLVVAIFLAESGFRPTAISRCGAMGLGQLMPGTARGLGVSNAYDTSQNIEASIRLISGHLGKYGNISLALSAYNAGPGAVKKYNGVPPYRETQNYVRKVASYYRQLCGNG